MIRQIRSCLARTGPTLAADAAGLAALTVLLMVGLYLPSLV